jgi:hypothetical protein
MKRHLPLNFVKKVILILFFFNSYPFFTSTAQEAATGYRIIDEYLRRNSLTYKLGQDFGLMLRSNFGLSNNSFYDSINKNDLDKSLFEINFSPIYLNHSLDFVRPYVGGEYGMIPARGNQFFFSGGVNFRYSILHVELQPEFVFAENLSYPGFPDSYSESIVYDRFHFWNVGDNPERFGQSAYLKYFFGQSGVSLRFGSFDFGIGTKNFWWGPGQWNSLIFSNNAPGFPYVSLNTYKPAKTFLGFFEGQIISGLLESSNQPPSQIDKLNSNFFFTLNSDKRYLNAFILSHTSRWIPSLTFGYSRSFQYYYKNKPNDLKGWIPILEPMEKDRLFTNSNSLEYDSRNQSQQIAIFGRYKMTNARAEIYFQFGRRDHALNWREFILNPEHARAYQLGFIKLVSLSNKEKFLQIRGEITTQQESVSRYLRYDLLGGISWHTHGQVRGFTNYGQSMGVGIGTGSNIQTLEVARIEKWNKFGVLFERLENNQDFFNRAFGQQNERKPWIDWSTALLWNTSYKNFYISGRLQGTYAINYQWGLSEKSNSKFPVSLNLFSAHSQLNLIYFIKTQKMK